MYQRGFCRIFFYYHFQAEVVCTKHSYRRHKLISGTVPSKVQHRATNNKNNDLEGWDSTGSDSSVHMTLESDLQ